MRRILGILAMVLSLSASLLSDAPSAAADHPWKPARIVSGILWRPPLDDHMVERPFSAPPTAYAAGHRGVDLRSRSDGIPRAPADGLIVFSGEVAGRGIVTIDHGQGYVSSLEPIDQRLPMGTTVRSGDTLGVLGVGPNASAGALHWGVRLRGQYMNPMILIEELPRAVLLPCC